MGALHDGHMSLYKEARKDNDIVISSVFVNPTQFNNPDDLKKYPRTEENDIAMLEKAGVDAVYIPGTEDIYPEKQKANIMILVVSKMKWKENSVRDILMV